jgi:hypothetical protein
LDALAHFGNGQINLFKLKCDRIAFRLCAGCLGLELVEQFDFLTRGKKGWWAICIGLS